MKITSKEAEQIIRSFSVDDPGPGAIERMTSHDWTFDPRGHTLQLLTRCFHEQQQVIYGFWRSFRETDTSDPSEFYCFWCCFCGASSPASPFVLAENFSGEERHICCPCAAALGVPLSPAALAVCSPLAQPRGGLVSAFSPASLLGFLRRFFS